jgi:hypothetical protein
MSMSKCGALDMAAESVVAELKEYVIAGQKREARF